LATSIDHYCSKHAKENIPGVAVRNMFDDREMRYADIKVLTARNVRQY
jgi:hypothetical protein